MFFVTPMRSATSPCPSLIADSFDDSATFPDSGHTEVVSRLIIAGCHVSRPDRNGLTAAHLAAARGSSGVLDKLLLAGYQVDMLAVPPLGVSRLFKKGFAYLEGSEKGYEA